MKNGNSMKTKLFFFLTFFFAFILFLCLGEIIFRLFIVKQHQHVEVSANSSYFVHEKKVKHLPWINTLIRNTQDGFRFNPSVNALIKNNRLSHRDIMVRTNSYGFRGEEIPEKKEKGKVRILFLGDSITAATYVQEEDTFVALTGKYLRNQGHHVRVINAGVGSLNLKEEIALLKENGFKVNPDIVLLGLYLNDHAERSKMYQMPSFFYRSYFLSWLYNRAFLALRQFYDERKKYRDWEKNFAHGRNLKPGNWKKDKDAFDYEIINASFDWGYSWEKQVWKEIYQPQIKMLKEILQQKGIKLHIMVLPVIYQVEAVFLYNEPQRYALELGKHLEIPVLDVLPALRKAYHEKKRVLFYDHCHLNREGNILVAQELKKFLSPLLQQK